MPSRRRRCARAPRVALKEGPSSACMGSGCISEAGGSCGSFVGSLVRCSFIRSNLSILIDYTKMYAPCRAALRVEGKRAFERAFALRPNSSRCAP